jgi:hypothetical protein
MWVALPIELTNDERAELERRLRAHSTSQRMARRYRVILLAAEGTVSRDMAPDIHGTFRTVVADKDLCRRDNRTIRQIIDLGQTQSLQFHFNAKISERPMLRPSLDDCNISAATIMPR